MHIFEPFYRASEAKLSSIQRSGLGLSINKEIVERHRGQIMLLTSLCLVMFLGFFSLPLSTTNAANAVNLEHLT